MLLIKLSPPHSMHFICNCTKVEEDNMEKAPTFNFALLMAVLIVMNGILLCRMPRAEAGRHKHSNLNMREQPQIIDCSCDTFCNPFGPKIDFRCRDSSDCQAKCNDFGGVFMCSFQSRYCKCETES